MNDAYPLIVLSASAYAGSSARAALDLALAFAVFNQQPRLLFCGDGVLQLVEGQSAAAIGRKSLRKVIDSLPLYDIDEIYADGAELAARGIGTESLPPGVQVLDAGGLRDLRNGARHLLSL